MPDAIQILIADLMESRYSSSQQNIIVPVDDFVAALNEIELAIGGGIIPSTIILTDNHILVGNALNQGADVAMSGDVTIVASGATTIGNNKVTTAKINNAAVTYAKIQNVATVSLLGNPTGAPAAPEEITLGTNLSFAGTVLNAAGAAAALLVEAGGASKISGLPAAAALTGAELAVIVQGGADVQTTTQDIANLGGGGGGWVAATQAINSSNLATTEIVLDLTVMASRVGVTTDGSGLVQLIDIPLFALDGNGVNTAMNGYRVSVTCDVQTVGGDIPLVTKNGATTIYGTGNNGFPSYSLTNGTGSGPANSVPIDYPGATAEFVWHEFDWYADNTGAPNDAIVNILDCGVGPVEAVASLPPAQPGARASVNNATMTLTLGIGTVVMGGGGNTVPVFYDGANWLIG